MVLSQRKGSPTSLPSSATIGARQGESAGEFYSPIPSSAIVTPVTGLRGKLDSGSPAIGIVLSIPSAVTAHIASRLGFDWACIDVESQTYSASTMAEMVAAIGNSETCTSLVRVPAHSSEWIRWAVEAGAQGIIVTGVQNREQMRHLVALCKSTASAGRSQQNQRMSGRHHYQQQQKNMQFGRELLIIPQIDRPEAVDDIDGILSVPESMPPLSIRMLSAVVRRVFFLPGAPSTGHWALLAGRVPSSGWCGPAIGSACLLVSRASIAMVKLECACSRDSKWLLLPTTLTSWPLGLLTSFVWRAPYEYIYNVLVFYIIEYHLISWLNPLIQYGIVKNN
ncbi:Pyruvate/Phosphoenolpyruvate kinase-like domain-containing protein [Kickxella alabastrina]|uniref:Pyruvate/Phosphoenolpyruvate kinase-like domain-containing protein n=1 Tax=Kickxella alabastrina TaxID=61397 RepID=UPI00221F5B17|nr:Pyruvate/Phosphoenolpyruvate kinase-like domain-containing protein [Kickxella alabastrina]KAI7823972.1 Pyruvate/Phosphoenolpyruvate kinase-like domain-containing protein [Kickxella alabastrina]